MELDFWEISRHKRRIRVGKVKEVVIRGVLWDGEKRWGRWYGKKKLGENFFKAPVKI